MNKATATRWLMRLREVKCAVWNTMNAYNDCRVDGIRGGWVPGVLAAGLEMANHWIGGRPDDVFVRSMGLTRLAVTSATWSHACDIINARDGWVPLPSETGGRQAEGTSGYVDLGQGVFVLRTSDNGTIVYAQNADGLTVEEQQERARCAMSETIWLHPTMALRRRQGATHPDQIAYFAPLLGTSGANVGNVTAEQVQRELHPTQAQTVLLVGPSGVGKSTLARQIGALRGGRVLYVDRSLWRRGVDTDFVEFIDLARPDVTILDDVDMRDTAVIGDMLQSLEEIRIPGHLLIITMMDDAMTEARSKEPGGLYFPGMRPGRVDEVVYIGLPDRADREKILRLYTDHPEVAAMAEATEGLTGAFLKRLAEKASTTQKPWQEILRVMRSTAPRVKEVQS